MAMQKRANLRLPPEINRVLYVRNLPYKISGEEMYDIFGKYGAIRQIRVGNTPDTRGKTRQFVSDLITSLFRRQARHLWSTKTSSMRRTPAIICQASTFAIVIWSSCTIRRRRPSTR